MLNVNFNELQNILDNGTRSELDAFCMQHHLVIRDNKIYPANKADGTETIKYWDKRQLVTKILLNSLYGAVLNEGCRFFDKRIGQSTTLTGRSITKHMCAETNRQLSGEYQHDGKCVIYSDTDSTYFSAVPVVPEDQILDKESAVALYDQIATIVSDSFPPFLKSAFNIPLDKGSIMQAGREVVGQSGLFITKKRYAIFVVDDEGKSTEKLKIMGMDIKRSDTPEFIQDFLEGILRDALLNVPESTVINQIKEFKKTFRALDSWKKGMPKRVNNLTPYTAKYERLKGLTKSSGALAGALIGKTKTPNNMIPGHVTASIHWNYLLQMHNDNYSTKITDGMKVIVCRLKPNPMGYDTVAYPVDEMHLPDWFKDLPFDDDGMEAAVLDKKIKNVLGVLNWDLHRANESEAMSTFFDF